ncbi:Uracil-DNA glycosylase [Orchesella cincta]|uniref:Uracil-DNA glycosylase n=1 Tax=Orchesella cincta TaxID=48709 RepID=A0A1D2MAX5_ORCCI|nr:Uracil-DNA glycosylase [Orchesella cincta]
MHTERDNLSFVLWLVVIQLNTMPHPFFVKVAVRSGLANYHASKALRDSLGKQPFSNIFSIFFLDDAYVLQDSGLDSWLEAIEKDFNFHEEGISSELIREVTALFQALGFYDPGSPGNVKVYKFWAYLFWLYEALVDANCGGEGNTFNFMKGLKTTSVRAVFMGNVPINMGAPTGYAFHGIQSQTTRQVLTFVGREMEQYSTHMGEAFLGISNSELAVAKQNCNLAGWIQQGVLLLNCCLTHHESGPIYHAWQIFMHFALRHLSYSVKNIPFILFGENVHYKKDFVNPHNNLVVPVYHPDQYAQNPHPVDMTKDWYYVAPFTVANFYLYYAHGRNGLVDWRSIGDIKPGVGYRLTKMAAFCEKKIVYGYQLPEDQRQNLPNNRFVVLL